MGDDRSDRARIAADGQSVAFVSRAENLVEGVPKFGVNARIYFRDLAAGETSMISVTMDGSATFGDSFRPAISFDGRFVAFDSPAEDIVEGDENDFRDVFLRDRAGLPGDVDGDGDVDFTDLVALLAAWGDCPEPPAECPADFDGDGAAGFFDLIILLAHWS